jgi:hypothetical protein
MQLQGNAKSIVRRLALLQDFNSLMPSLQRSEAVAGVFRALIAAALPVAAAPASWWDVECDVALMVGMHRHGYANFEAVRQDPDLTAAFQVGGLLVCLLACGWRSGRVGWGDRLGCMLKLRLLLLLSCFGVTRLRVGVLCGNAPLQISACS